MNKTEMWNEIKSYPKNICEIQEYLRAILGVIVLSGSDAAMINNLGWVSDLNNMVVKK